VRYGRESGGIDFLEIFLGNHNRDYEKEKKANEEQNRVSNESQVYQDYYNEGFAVGLGESFHSNLVNGFGFGGLFLNQGKLLQRFLGKIN
jgi:hypothetical protein